MYRLIRGMEFVKKKKKKNKWSKQTLNYSIVPKKMGKHLGATIRILSIRLL